MNNFRIKKAISLNEIHTFPKSSTVILEEQIEIIIYLYNLNIKHENKLLNENKEF